MKSILSVFSFIGHAYGVLFKKSLTQATEIFCFLLNVLWFCFQCYGLLLIFELIFIGVMPGLRHKDIQFFQHNLKTIFPCGITLA